DWYGYLDQLKSFCHKYHYDSVVVVKYAVRPPRPQVVAVYSDNTDVLNQICCELEESSNCLQSDVLEAGEFIQGCLQVYHLPEGIFSSASMAAELEDGLHSHLKSFVERRGSVLACHPSSRTSSTEGVAGSVEFSQGSSGITDMYGSDTERTCAEEVSMAGEMADREGDSGGAGVGGGGGELVSPDSGMATIRSSRSSKESSVFLSDDSPMGHLAERAWVGSPFAGDLMEEVADEEDMEYEGRDRVLLNRHPSISSSSTSSSHKIPSKRGPDPSSLSQPCETVLYQWTRNASSPECQAQYGYNYHRTDQRTDHQNARCGDPDGGDDRWQDPSTGPVELEHETRTAARSPITRATAAGSMWPRTHPLPPDKVQVIVFRTSEQGDYAASTHRTGKERVNQDDEGENQEGSHHRTKLTTPPSDASSDHSDGSLSSDDAVGSTDDSVEIGRALRLNTGVGGGEEEDEEEAAGDAQEAIPEYSAAEERRDSGLWRSYYGDQNAIVVFAACFLPDSNCENYNYVMENLFLLKKNLKLFIIVHPSWFIRTVLGLTRPFISYKFSSKIKYVHSLAELWGMVPMEYVHIPAKSGRGVTLRYDGGSSCCKASTPRTTGTGRRSLGVSWTDRQLVVERRSHRRSPTPYTQMERTWWPSHGGYTGPSCHSHLTSRARELMSVRSYLTSGMEEPGTSGMRWMVAQRNSSGLYVSLAHSISRCTRSFCSTLRT
ncbi:hypothetical protein CRUP_032264, partial [Coryphaenoides rupestris]